MMQYRKVEQFILRCMDAEATAALWTVRWCDEEKFVAENSVDVSPGGFMNRYGYFVIGTTVGGNAVAVSDQNDLVVFAGHSWYFDDWICFEDLGGSKEWIEVPWSLENFQRSLFKLSNSRQQLIEKIRNGELEKILNAID